LIEARAGKSRSAIAGRAPEVPPRIARITRFTRIVDQKNGVGEMRVIILSLSLSVLPCTSRLRLRLGLVQVAAPAHGEVSRC
jgi:hypothetical protein